MMKSLAIALTSATCLTVGATVVPATPATAGTLSFDYEASFSGDIQLNPIVSGLLDFPEDSFDFSETLSGSFTTLDDPNQFLDGDITLDSSFFSSLLGVDVNSDPDLAFLNELLSMDFAGTGTLNSDTGTTGFEFNYLNDLDAIVIDNFDTDVVNDCLTGVCTVDDGIWDFGLFANSQLVNDLLDLDLPPFLLGEEFLIAQGGGDFTLATAPQTGSTSVPEPATWLGLLAIGGWTIKRKVTSVQAS
jgi:hypothetical protein